MFYFYRVGRHLNLNLSRAAPIGATFRALATRSKGLGGSGSRGPGKMAPPSAKDEKNWAQLNQLLADKSYLGGGGKPTDQDLKTFLEIEKSVDKKQYPHLARWYTHIDALRVKFQGKLTGSIPSAPSSPPKAVAGASAAKAKAKAAAAAPAKGEKKQLVIDCKPVLVEDIRRPHDGVDLCVGSKCLDAAKKKGAGRYYITTAINYSNGFPHIGHAYEALTSDVFARYHRLKGEDVFFMTGADEHGQKIAEKAEGEGLKPIEICDRYALGFQGLNQRLLMSNDFYIRTTAERHKQTAQKIWGICRDKGDIYLDHYEGWYLVREERFIPDNEAQEWNFKDPLSGNPLKKMSEPSFFFRLSKFQEKVIKHIEDNELFVQPSQYRGEILERLRGIELRDLSISRGTFDWGVPCPEDKVEGKNHVMYVWFDALINYISGVDGIDPSKPLSRFWPADMHIIGKDISWFHSVIWPAMLMSAEIPLPKSIVVHGFIAGADGRKMSKSLGNVVDAHDLLDTYPCDSVRWYLCRDSSFGDDVKFSEESLRLMHNSELCDNLGNLVNRAIALTGGAVQTCDASALGSIDLPFDLNALAECTEEAFTWYRLSAAAEAAIRACGATNKWIADLEPWKMKDAELANKKVAICRILLEAVYILAHFFAPFIPQASDAIFKKIGSGPRPIKDLKDNFLNLPEGQKVTSGSVLFAVMDAKAS